MPRYSAPKKAAMLWMHIRCPLVNKSENRPGSAIPPSAWVINAPRPTALCFILFEQRVGQVNAKAGIRGGSGPHQRQAVISLGLDQCQGSRDDRRMHTGGTDECEECADQGDAQGPGNVMERHGALGDILTQYCPQRTDEAQHQRQHDQGFQYGQPCLAIFTRLILPVSIVFPDVLAEVEGEAGGRDHHAGCDLHGGFSLHPIVFCLSFTRLHPVPRHRSRRYTSPPVRRACRWIFPLPGSRSHNRANPRSPSASARPAGRG